MLAYTRKFIILKKEFSSLEHLNPKGHCKLEVKGIRGSFTINIENAEVDNFYQVTLLFKDKEKKSLELGKIITNNLGKGRGEYTLNLRELETRGYLIDKLSAILIRGEEKVLLGGYVDKEDGSIEGYVNSLGNYLVEEDMKNSAFQDFQEEEDDLGLGLLEEKATVEEELEKAYLDLEGIREGDRKIEESMEEEILEPVEDREESIIDTIEESSEVGYEAEEVIYEEKEEEEILIDRSEDPLEELDSIEDNKKNQTTNYVLSILRYFPYIEPFNYNLRNHNWWIIDLDMKNDYRAFLPYFSYLSGGNNKKDYTNGITCNQLMGKYGHYLFGLYNEGDDVKYFVYGIPGEFIKEEYPDKDSNEFARWHQGIRAPGYWLIYIDPINGMPLYPKVPAIPTD